MAYGVTYGSKTLTGTAEISVATLTIAATTQAGTATIDAGEKPTKIAD